ncbi:hypothetical protein [Clostridium tyrobutyricum]|uniref:hypothetical protein n=1 Tax=Clostridium tyrobutyricum TaxID=1519 RepID=UPI00189D4DE7|nr:hypothetical protein [Clostridium tyrobutyricum]
MKSYYKNLDQCFKNKTQQGSALEELSELILRCTRGFYVTRKVRTGTNQLDCTIRNDYDIKLTIYQELGSILIGECKNEKETPGNSYYYKLYGILQRSKGKDERRVGILFSREEVASTCMQIAREFFIRDNIIIVNFYDEDLKKITEGNNFLIMLQRKIQTLKLDIRTSPEKHGLYEDHKIEY